MAINLDDYVDVAERVRLFASKHPEGSLQPWEKPTLAEFGGKAWIIYTAAAFRTPDDPRPGVGTAWEQVPGATAFTRGSEMQNAETAAWGRAIVAALAADTSRVASRQEVQARQPEQVDVEPWIAHQMEAAANADYAGLQTLYQEVRNAAIHGLTDAQRVNLLDHITVLGKTAADEPTVTAQATDDAEATK